MTYDPKTDPLRVTENVVRAEIAAINERGQFPSGFHLVKQGAFMPGGKGDYAAVRVVCLRDDPTWEDRPFSIHTAVLKVDGDAAEHPTVYLVSGHYDLTVEQAAERL